VRLVVDTNILVSALLASTSLPAHLITLWRESRFDLLTSLEQLDELMRVTRYPKIRERLTPSLAGRLINELRDIETVVDNLPALTDDFSNPGPFPPRASVESPPPQPIPSRRASAFGTAGGDGCRVSPFLSASTRASG
jgi:putative PIN family toxin of toxin-antitoxin system